MLFKFSRRVIGFFDWTSRGSRGHNIMYSRGKITLFVSVGCVLIEKAPIDLAVVACDACNR